MIYGNQNFKNMVSKLGVELLQTVRDAGNQVIDDAVFEERVWGFSRAVDAMLECGIPSDKIIASASRINSSISSPLRMGGLFATV